MWWSRLLMLGTVLAALSARRVGALEDARAQAAPLRARVRVLEELPDESPELSEMASLTGAQTADGELFTSTMKMKRVLAEGDDDDDDDNDDDDDDDDDGHPTTTVAPTAKPASFPTSAPTMPPTVLPTFTSTAERHTRTRTPTGDPTEEERQLDEDDDDDDYSATGDEAVTAAPTMAFVPENPPTHDRGAGLSLQPTTAAFAIAPPTSEVEEVNDGRSTRPSVQPSAGPSPKPSRNPSPSPSPAPSPKPSVHTSPILDPALNPSSGASSMPSPSPSSHPNADVPSATPTPTSSSPPTDWPSINDDDDDDDTDDYDGNDGDEPLGIITPEPTAAPSEFLEPTGKPSFALEPTEQPSGASTTRGEDDDDDDDYDDDDGVPSLTPRPPTSTPVTMSTLLPLSFTSASFEASLFEVSAHFSRAVDIAVYDDEFPCQSLFFGPGLTADDICSWVSDTQLRMLPRALVPGDRLRVRSNQVVGVAGDSAEGSVSVDAPTSPTAPLVVLAHPTFISKCRSTFDIRATKSRGSGGRDFLGVTWAFDQSASVTSPSAAEYLTELLVNATALGSLKVTFETGRLDDDGVYVFVVTITNFVGESDSGVATVALQNVADPLVTIANAATIYTTPATPLRLDADAGVGCADAGGSLLSHNWQEPTGKLMALGNLSRRPSTLLLAAGTLAPNTTYSFEYAVESASGRLSHANVDVVVSSGSLVLDVVGCDASVAAGEDHTISAAFSYDENLGKDVFAADADIRVIITLTPNSAPTCSTTIELEVFDATVEMTSGNYAGCVLDVHVAILKDSRREERRCSVAFTSASAPTPTAFRDDAARHTPHLKAVVRGLVPTTTDMDVVATWQLMSGVLSGGETLDDAKLSSSGATFMATAATATRSFDLAIMPNGMVPGRTYTFALSTAPPGGAESASQSVTIEVNTPPVLSADGGALVVSPAVGEAFSPFTLDAGMWTDDERDLPLSYVFKAQKLALNIFPSGANFLAAAVLPQGVPVVCDVNVADAFGAVASANASVAVSGIVDETAALETSTTALEELDPVDIDRTFQVVGAAVAVAEVLEDAEERLGLLTNCIEQLDAALTFVDDSAEAFRAQAALISRIVGAAQLPSGAFAEAASQTLATIIDGMLDDADPAASTSSLETEASLLSAISSLSSQAQFNASVATGLREKIGDVQRLGANAMAPGESSSVFETPQFVAAAAVYRKYVDAVDAVVVGDKVVLERDAVETIQVADGEDYMVASVEFAQYPIDTVASNASVVEGNRLVVSKVLSVSVVVNGDATVGDFVPGTTTRHELQGAVVDMSRDPHAELSCEAESTATLEHRCPNGQGASYICNGTEITVVFTCPETLFSCVIFDAPSDAFVDRPSCAAVVTPSTVECRCSGEQAQSSRRRRRLQSRSPLPSSNFAAATTQRSEALTALVLDNAGEAPEVLLVLVDQDTTADGDDGSTADTVLVGSVVGGFVVVMLLLAGIGARADSTNRRNTWKNLTGTGFESCFEPIVRSAHEGLWYGLSLMSPEEACVYERQEIWRWAWREIAQRHSFLRGLVAPKAATSAKTTSKLALAAEITTVVLTTMAVTAALLLILLSTNVNLLDADLRLKSIVWMAALVLTVTKPLSNVAGILVDSYLRSDLEFASERYAARQAKLAAERKEREEALFQRELELLSQESRLRPDGGCLGSMGGVCAYPVRRALRARVSEAVDLETRLEQEEENFGSLGLRGTDAHGVALLIRRRAVVMIGIRDNMPWLARSLFCRYTRLSSSRVIAPSEKCLAGVALLAYLVACLGCVAMFAISEERHAAMIWLVVFLTAQIFDALFLMPAHILVQTLVLPSLLRNHVSLAKLGRVRPCQTLAVLLRNNADVIDLCPGIEIFVPLSVALWEARVPPGLCESALYVQQRYIFEDAKETEMRELSIAEWLPGPTARGKPARTVATSFTSMSDSESERKSGSDSERRPESDRRSSGRRSSDSEHRASFSSEHQRSSATIEHKSTWETERRYAITSESQKKSTWRTEETTPTEQRYPPAPVSVEEEQPTWETEHKFGDAQRPSTAGSSAGVPYLDIEEKSTATWESERKSASFAGSESTAVPDHYYARSGPLPAEEKHAPTMRTLTEEKSGGDSEFADENSGSERTFRRSARQGSTMRFVRPGSSAWMTMKRIYSDGTLRDLESLRSKEDRDQDDASSSIPPLDSTKSNSRLSYGSALFTLHRVEAGQALCLCILQLLFLVFLALPNEVQSLLSELFVPWAIAAFVCFVDLGFGSEVTELGVELAIVFGALILVICLVALLERRAARSVNRIKNAL